MKGGDQPLNFPAGFRFHPTDEELVAHYLCRRCAGQNIDAPIVAEIDLYKFDPWQLPGMSLYGEKEWYFFSPRDRKYPNGSRPNRSAGSGYWKATGADKPVGKPKTLGIKKALVFYAGKAPRGIKTNWIMHEYRLANVDRSAGKKNNLRLDDWVLCRIYNKKGALEKHYNEDHHEEQKPNVNNGLAMVQAPQRVNESIHTDSSSSEHVLSSEFKSEPKWNHEFENGLHFQMNYMDGFQDDPLNFGSQMNYDDQMSLFQDVHKPF